MNPHAALEEQIARYRRMSGEDRLGIALSLHELACDVAREGIRSRCPGADDAEGERQLHFRLSLVREAREGPAGDAAGIVAVQGDQLDRSYLKHWAHELGVVTELADLLSGKIRPKNT